MALAGLTVEVGANTARLETGMARAASAVETQTRRMNELVGGLQSLLGSLGVGISFGAIVNEALNLEKAIAGIGDAAKGLGVSTSDLQGLQYAFKATGVETDQFSAMMSRLDKNIGDAAGGSKNAQAIFRGLGVSYADARGNARDLVSVLYDIADQFKYNADGATKTELATAAFGRGARVLIAALDEGAGSLRKMNDELGQMGGKVGDDAIKKAHEFEVQITALKAQVRVAESDALEPLVVQLTMIAENFNRARASGEGFWGSLRAAAPENLGTKTVEQLQNLRALNAAPGQKYPTLAESVVKQIDAEIARRNEGEAGLASMQAEIARAQHFGGAGANVRPLAPIAKTSGPARGSIADRGELDNQLKTLDAFIRAEDSALKSRDDTLKHYYNEDQISIADYFDAKAKLEAANVASVTAAYNDEIVATVEYANKKTTTAERSAEAMAKVSDLIGKRDLVEQAGAQAASKDSQERAAALEAYADKVARFNVDLLTMQGRLEDAAVAQARLSDQQLKARAALEGDTATVNAIAQRDALIVVQGRLNQQTANANAIDENLATTIGRINLLYESGAITELEAIARIDAARQAQIGPLEKIAAAYDELAPENPGNKQMQADADAYRLKINQLADAANAFGKKFRDVFETSFADSFASFIDGTKSMSEAMRAFEQSVLQALSHIAAQNIAESIFGGMGGGAGGGFLGSVAGWVGSLFGAGGGGATLAQLGKAQGGYVSSSSAYLVGEKGPELFTPNSSGTISPAGSFGGTTINIVMPAGAQITRDSANLLGATVARHLAVAHVRGN